MKKMLKLLRYMSPQHHVTIATDSARFIVSYSQPQEQYVIEKHYPDGGIMVFFEEHRPWRAFPRSVAQVNHLALVKSTV